jgi:hypothetical protein
VCESFIPSSCVVHSFSSFRFNPLFFVLSTFKSSEIYHKKKYCQLNRTHLDSETFLRDKNGRRYRKSSVGQLSRERFCVSSLHSLTNSVCILCNFVKVQCMQSRQYHQEKNDDICSFISIFCERILFLLRLGQRLS